MTLNNIDPQEVAKFENIADRWWDTEGEFKPLHDINPLRLAFIQQHADLKNQKVIDVGCGGGILAESLALQGASVTGIDMSPASLNAAREHRDTNNLSIDYQEIAAEEMAEKHSGKFDVVTCMELLEHVPDPLSLIQACAKLIKPEGHVFFSTLNRTLKSYGMAILGAEYLLQLLPKGTHDYAKFIRPSELAAWTREANLSIKNLKGMSYNLFSKDYYLSDDVSVNYLVHCQ
jgi:2-polyprenyl-6-hydroxyphenyl methylase/3-demethylubiquinone-9 3-methyltransferase